MSRLLAASLVILLGSAPVLAADPPLLVVSKRAGSANIYLVNADGSEAKNLTDNKFQNISPAWSPDGKRIAFSSDRDGDLNVYVMGADGKNVTRLTRDHTDRLPSWSADGKTIVFCRATDDGSRIYSVPAAGGEAKELGEGDGWDPAFSPDGKKVLFTSMRDGGGFRVYVMDADGKNVKALTEKPNPNGFVYPAWSPDGKRIAWTDHTDDGLQVFVADADGKNAKQVTKLGGVATYAAWSPDGKTIAFYHFEGENPGTFYLMDADGKNQKALLKDEAVVDGARPAWRPKP
jgi:TolB protein